MEGPSQPLCIQQAPEQSCSEENTTYRIEKMDTEEENGIGEKGMSVCVREREREREREKDR